MSVEVIGLDALRRKLKIGRYSPAFRDFFRSTTKQAEAAGRAGIPEYSGELKGSVSSRVDSGGISGFGEVRFGARHAGAVSGGSKPHFPPPDELEGWGRAHGFPEGSGFIIARAISRKGTPARRFIARTFAVARTTMSSGVSGLARQIEARFGRG